MRIVRVDTEPGWKLLRDTEPEADCTVYIFGHYTPESVSGLFHAARFRVTRTPEGHRMGTWEPADSRDFPDETMMDRIPISDVVYWHRPNSGELSDDPGPRPSFLPGDWERRVLLPENVHTRRERERRAMGQRMSLEDARTEYARLEREQYEREKEERARKYGVAKSQHTGKHKSTKGRTGQVGPYRRF